MPTLERKRTFDDMSRYFTERAESNEWAVEPFDLSAEKVRHEQIMGYMRPGEGWTVSSLRPGRYVRLVHKREVVMSTTPWEQQTNQEVVREARGRVLIAGLGLGMILLPIMRKPEVESILVLEKSPDVEALVTPRLPLNAKVTVILADAFTWRPWASKGGAWRRPVPKFDTIYFDIWSFVSADNAAEIGRLHQRYKNWKAPGGWMGSWCQEVVRYKRDQDRRAGW